jgi:ribokinase
MARVVVLGASTTDMNIRFPHLPKPGQTLIGGEFFTGPGGKGANQAVAARRAGGDVLFLTAFGDDAFGRAIAKHDREEGVDVSHAKTVAGSPSGIALIFVSDTGENLIGVAMGANAHLTPEDIDHLAPEVFGQGGVLLASLEVPIATVARAIDRAKHAGMTVIVNPAPADKRLVELGAMPHIDVLTPNQSEAETLAGFSIENDADLPRLAGALRDLGVKRVVVTLGSQGCLVVDGSTIDSIPAHPVKVVDTVGAGDAFNGALAVALAEGRSLSAAARWAVRAGAIAVTKAGAQGALPTRAEIDSLQ